MTVSRVKEIETGINWVETQRTRDTQTDGQIQRDRERDKGKEKRHRCTDRQTPKCRGFLYRHGKKPGKFLFLLLLLIHILINSSDTLIT